MRGRRGRALKRRNLARLSRASLEAMLEVAEEGLAEIIAEIDAGDESPHQITERCICEHNRQLLAGHLARLQA